MSLVEEALRQLVQDANAPDIFIPFNYSSPALEARCRVKTGASYLFGFTVSNSNAAARFIQVFDLDTFPANGAVPHIVVSAAAAGEPTTAWVSLKRVERSTPCELSWKGGGIGR